jgi:ABC-type uncharacterized transport system substrate-binding protein
MTMKRREFITLLGGAAAAWPLAARAQQLKQVRRIGILMNQAPDEPVTLLRLSAFTHELQRLGWSAGENVRIDRRWSGGDAQRMRRYATELVALAPDVLRDANSSMIVTSNSLAGVHRDLLIALAAKYKLPAVYFSRAFVASGGLMSYGPDIEDQYRRAAAYVDRILKGEKASDLPVQAPTKYELAINLKTAKVLGLTIAPAFVARANEVIE